MGEEDAIGWEDVFVDCVMDEVGPPDAEDERDEDALRKRLLAKGPYGSS